MSNLAGKQYGAMQMFTSYDSMLYVTAAFDGLNDGTQVSRKRDEGRGPGREAVGGNERACQRACAFFLCSAQEGLWRGG